MRAGNDPVVRGLLLTVGGTSDPMAHTLLAIRPAHAVLVCSEQTLRTAEDVKTLVRDLVGPAPPPCFETRKVGDPADLVSCFTTVRQGLEHLKESCGLPKDAIRIDYTGGTKTMSAAAVLAAAPEGYEFIYVTGTERTKNGVGVVVSGKEQIVHPPNPWTVLEEPDTKAVIACADEGQWRAAVAIVKRLSGRAAGGQRSLFDAWTKTLLGLEAWDRFAHEEVQRHWGERGAVPTRLRDLAAVSGRTTIVGLAERCISLLRFLDPVVKARTAAPRPDAADPVVVDLVANADRWAARGHHDEAALRLYRALELFAQRRLRLPHGVDNSAVGVEQVPDAVLRKAIEQRHGPAPWKLGLKDSADLLSAHGDEAGRRLAANLDRLDTQARNENWLIHGDRHVGEQACLSFRKGVLTALGIEEDRIPAWPRFKA